MITKEWEQMKQNEHVEREKEKEKEWRRGDDRRKKRLLGMRKEKIWEEMERKEKWEERTGIKIMMIKRREKRKCRERRTEQNKTTQ